MCVYITETNKSDNEDQQLDQIRVCNIHWHRPPFFRPEGSTLRKDQRVSRLALVSLPIYYHKRRQRTISVLVSPVYTSPVYKFNLFPILELFLV